MVNKEISINYLNSNHKINCAQFYCLKNFNCDIGKIQSQSTANTLLYSSHTLICSKGRHLLHEATIYEATIQEL